MPGGGVHVDIPKDLVGAAARRRLLPFIGSGFSKNISAEFPDWKGVVDIAADILKFDRDLLRIHGDYLQIAEYLEVVNGGIGDLANKLVTLIDDERMFDVGKSRPHLLLPYLDCESIFTTNWDRWIERAFDDQGWPYYRIRNTADLADPTLNRPPASNVQIFGKVKFDATRYNHPTRVVKLHGDLSDHSSLLIKESDYFRRMDFEDPLDIDLRSRIYGKSVIFIGYSFSDLNVRLMWSKLCRVLANTKKPAQSFFLTAQRNPVMERLLSEQHINVVQLDPMRIGENLTYLLECILDAQEKGNA
ncbi:MAG: SIR2 family protein [Rhodanobacteraceae bacterium]|nr:SIR2 family protein [Rhodanobacteraceae bacterium]